MKSALFYQSLIDVPDPDGLEEKYDRAFRTCEEIIYGTNESDLQGLMSSTELLFTHTQDYLKTIMGLNFRTCRKKKYLS
ncbi:hypothetical protein quinque_008859 [Culex quinquefasciatus]